MSYSLFLHRTSKRWHYRFQIKPFPRIQRSTRETNKKRAQIVADRVYRDALTRANGGEPVPTLRGLIEQWQELHGPVVSAVHRTGVDTFSRLHLYQLGDLYINCLTTDEVVRARNAHMVGRLPASVNHWVRTLKLLVNWAVRRKIIEQLPWSGLVEMPIQKAPRPTLPLARVQDWICALDKTTWRRPGVGTAVRLMFGLGLRESEAASARWEWFDWERQTYTPGITKGKEAEPVPVPEWLCDFLAPVVQVEGLVATQRNGDAFKPGFARTAMYSANKACKLTGITPHRLRGTYATMLSEAGVPIQTIKEIMRHKDARTTMAYLETNMDIAKRALNMISHKVGYIGRDIPAQRRKRPRAIRSAN